MELFKCVMVAFLSSGCVFTIPIGKRVISEPPVNKSRWMTELRQHIGDKQLSELYLPKTHDSGTFGIKKDFILVDRNPLFELAELVLPDVLVNWSKTQPENLWNQLSVGFRAFDLRIADVGDEDLGNFRWWHGITGETIQEGFTHIRDFAVQNSQEILLLRFGHFAKPAEGGKQAIPDERKDELADYIIEMLEERMVVHNSVPENPTINQVLATGKNIIALVDDAYICAKHVGFWPPTAVASNWTGRSNSEDLFNQRSELLQYFKNNDQHRMSEISGCVTPNAKIIIGSLLNTFLNDPIARAIIEIIFPELLDINTKEMSFEGLWTDTLTMAARGVNSLGMRARDKDFFTNGASVHYSGLNDMVRHWIARPGLFHPNIISVDNTRATTIVDTLILANKGEIPREVAIAFQGNPRDGFYEWDGLIATGGRDGLSCRTGYARYRVHVGNNAIVDWTNLANKTLLTFTEGQYPPGASVDVSVGSDGQTWHPLLTGNIGRMIETTRDMYLRVADLGEGHGFGYMSTDYNLFGDNCTHLPDGADDNARW